VPRLILKKGQIQLDDFSLENDLHTIGRGSPESEVDFPLSDRSHKVSRLHGMTVRDKSGRFWVVDLSSVNGIYVNRVPVYRKRLDNGDVIRIGDFRLIYDESESDNSQGPIWYPAEYGDISEIPAGETSTVIDDDRRLKNVSMDVEAQLRLNEILQRLKHLGLSLKTGHELVELLVKSVNGWRGFIAAFHDQVALVPTSMHGFRDSEANSFRPWQSGIEQALREGNAVQLEHRSGGVLCCPLTDEEGAAGLIYIQSRPGERFAAGSQVLLQEVGAWLRGRSAPLLGGEPESPEAAVGWGRIDWSAPMVAASRTMRDVVVEADRVAETDEAVLVTGETGVGKDVLAHHIHARSPRSNGPFQAVEVPAVATSLFEAELFGRQKGAYTGADASVAGAFEKADGGTLFLDELGHASMEVLTKLKRAVEAKEYKAVGAGSARVADLRIVAATNVDLDQAVKDDKFPLDLLKRFPVRLAIPPLRNRAFDLPVLFNFFIDRLEGPLQAISNGAMRLLVKYSYPGNTRDVIRMIKNWNLEGMTVVLSADLPSEIVDEIAAGSTDTGKVRTIKDIERQEIVRVLRLTGWNKTRAAQKLGMAKQTLYNKIKAFGITEEEA